MQKESPFLDDFNYLIGLKYQMGEPMSVDGSESHMPNSTKCLTWNRVKISHMAENNRVVMKLEDMYGLLMLFASGILGAILLISIELILNVLKQKKKAISSDQGQ